MSQSFKEDIRLQSKPMSTLENARLSNIRYSWLESTRCLDYDEHQSLFDKHNDIFPYLVSLLSAVP